MGSIAVLRWSFHANAGSGRLVEMDDICPAVAEKLSFTKARRASELGDTAAGLEMRIENDFDDREDAAGHERAE